MAIVVIPTDDPRRRPPNETLRPKTFTVTMSADQLTIFVRFKYDLEWKSLDFVPTIRLWFIDATKVSPDLVTSAAGIDAAKKYNSVMLTSFAASSQAHIVPLPIGSYPDVFQNGGWFWADSPGSGDSAYFPSSALVPVPTRNIFTALPAYQVGQMYVTNAPVTIDGVACQELRFSWMNPDLLDTLRYVLIVMYNYRNLGTYEEVMRLSAPQVNGSLTTPTRVDRGRSASIGPVRLISDLDGVHNVTFYLVVENQSKQHASNYVAIPAASVIFIGGI